MTDDQLSNVSPQKRFDFDRKSPIADSQARRAPSISRRLSSVIFDIFTPRLDGTTNVESMPFCQQQTISGLPLYEDEYLNRPKVSQVIRSMSIYNPTLPGVSEDEKEMKPKTAQMGTFMGVYLPCLQNIFGVLFFIRLTWIVGTAGIFHGFFIVLLCCSVTFLTSISLSAIATNGMVPAGGPYYMISRNLGPELGGAIGILFYLGTTIAGAMYVLGAVEILVLYLVPSAQIFDSMHHCFRLFGTGLLLCLSLIVMSGMKIVNKFALPAVTIVVCCILATFVGIFVKFTGTDSFRFCVVGDRPVDLVGYLQGDSGRHVPNCTWSGLRPLFCKVDNVTGQLDDCDRYYSDKIADIGEKTAISGLASGVFFDNLQPKYLESRVAISKKVEEESENESNGPMYVYSDVATSFMVLVGIFFPSCTGIMAGSNRSGDLKDASRSIPKGTIAATLTTSFVYLLGVVLFGASMSSLFLRDKFGKSAQGRLAIADLAVPHPIVILIGCFMSTVGAGMQSLTGAPRLLQAIASDDVIPLLRPFKVADSRGEPIRAIICTFCICELGILIAVLENITALITQFFLMCYLGVNAACALQSLLKSPSWRPSFRYFHWSLSTLGALLCVSVMFISAWLFALIAISIGFIVYKYIQYQDAQKEWGDGLRGLCLSAARFALLSIEEKPQHTKNWRPQLLVICPDLEGDEHDNLIAFVSQLKAGKGLTVLTHVLKGDFAADSAVAEQAKEKLATSIKNQKIKGFCDVLVSKSVTEGVSCLIQTSALGCLRHNTVIRPWPDSWRHDNRGVIESSRRFVSTFRTSSAANCAILVPKNIGSFPSSNTKMSGYLDVWWIVHDGGLLMLLPFLLKQHRTWRNTRLRIFSIATHEDNSVKMSDDLRTFLYHLRIEAEVFVIETPNSDITDYTYERTLLMEQRYKILRDMRLNAKERQLDIQSAIVDAAHERKLSTLSRIVEEEVSDSHKISSVIGTDHRASQIRFNVHDDVKVEFCESSPGNTSIDYDSELPANEQQKDLEYSPKSYLNLQRDNVRRMHTAIRLNELMREKSADAKLVVVNLPGPGQYTIGSDHYYMEFIEALTESLDRVLLVKGTGSEVVTIYS